jgi:dihydrofolate synthase/folylpolyglutamate synthase
VITGWRDLLQGSPPLGASREARHKRFRAIIDRYARAFGPMPLIVKVTGTSGKGSVCALLEAAVMADGKPVGVFTSPHLVEPTERIRINGHDVTSSALDQIAIDTAPFFEALVSELGPMYRPPFFEALLVLALRLFTHERCSVAIIEVAIGGANDIVSQLNSPIAAITSIGRDHVEELGPTLADVARDKAGIASPGSTLITGPSIDAVAMDEIKKDAARRNIRIVESETSKLRSRSRGIHGHAVTLDTESGTIEFTLPLAGDFQVENLKTAYATLLALKNLGVVTGAECIQGVSHARWPARVEVFPGTPPWIIDAAHNTLAFTALESFLHSALPSGHRTLVLGTSDVEKALDAIRILGPRFDEVILVGGFYKAIDFEAIDFEAIDPAIWPMDRRPAIFSSPPEMMEWVLRCRSSQSDRIVVAGSIYLAGACRALLLEHGYVPRSDSH